MSTTITQDRHREVVDALVGLAPDGVAYVPSASIAPIINGALEAQEKGDLPLVYAVSREEEAVGLVSAYPFADKFGVIIMQDNGFGNALTALTTMAVSYHLPLLIVANTRGGLGEYNSMIHSISEPVPELLRSSNIPVFRVDRRNPAEDWGATVKEAGNHAKMTFRPVVVLMEFYDHKDAKAKA
ncbi:thiamine pyrophosphate-binding protein [Arthrobacter sp. ISL-30]|uniref:thiamine pyrophosphate-binding protein n=1 Tax=Arthrobacter sp. ISL-30 TaxID=2819109 RepID=UPI0020352CE4|nr:thiamine pyrophosphate-binding protein [Arthrobacter sp. ISL-30]